ncbi:MAG: hypothetical protein ACQCN4_00480 [Candidatus Bathyarchaeia archaeon]|jgi:hypothetical protein
MLKKLLPVVGLLLVLCLFIPSSEATLTKPNVPGFTINMYDSSYDIAPTSSVDSFTGKTIEVPGRHVEERIIEIRIKNPYLLSGSGVYPTDFHYDIHYRGHFGTDQSWQSVFETRYGFLQPVSSSEETIYTVVLHPDYSGINVATWCRYVPDNATIDFQVRAFIGGYTGTPLTEWIFTGETSDWSDTKTITLNFDTPVPKYVPPPAEMNGVITYASPQATPTDSATSQPTSTPTNADNDNLPASQPTETTPSTPTNADSDISPTDQPTENAAAPGQQNNELTASSELDPVVVIAVVAILAVVIIFTVIIIKRHQGV